MRLRDAVLSLCLAAPPGRELTAAGSIPVSLAAIGVHMGAMLVVTAAIAVIVYDWLGLSFLRRGWINLDYLWIGALTVTGFILIL